MTSPSQIAGASLGGSVAGTGLNVLGALGTGAAQSGMYKYQAGIALANAQIAQQNRQYALQVGDQQQQQYGMKAAQRQGMIRAAQGASNIAVGSGSTADVVAGQKLTTKMDTQTIRDNAARVAYGYQVEGVMDTAQANLYDMAAENASQAGGLKALGSLISGSTSVADKWLQMGQYGL